MLLVAEEGLEVREGREFGSLSCGREALGLEGGGEVVVERLEDGVIVGGALWRDAIFEEGYSWGGTGGCVDGADRRKKTGMVA